MDREVRESMEREVREREKERERERGRDGRSCHLFWSMDRVPSYH
jgi:hypothetical protein